MIVCDYEPGVLHLDEKEVMPLLRAKTRYIEIKAQSLCDHFVCSSFVHSLLNWENFANQGS